MNYTQFNIEPFQLLEGYIENFTNLVDPLPKITQKNDEFKVIGNSFKENYTSYSDTEFKDLNTKYDIIDNSGNLLYKKNINFKETIPNLKDAILEDSINILNYNNNIYAISGIAIGFLIIGIIVSSNKG